MRAIARVDLKQKEIIDALRKAGRSVQPIHTIGKGCPDLLVGYQGVNYLIEVKSAGGKLTEDQINFIKSWKGNLVIARSAEEAIQVTK